jgi:hypothetical protein
MLNSKIQSLNEELAGVAQDLTKYSADLEAAEVGYEATSTTIEDTEDTFRALTGLSFSEIGNYEIQTISLNGENKGHSSGEEDRFGYLVHNNETWFGSWSEPSCQISSTAKANATINLKGTLKPVDF